LGAIKTCMHLCLLLWYHLELELELKNDLEMEMEMAQAVALVLVDPHFGSRHLQKNPDRQCPVAILQ